MNESKKERKKEYMKQKGERKRDLDKPTKYAKRRNESMNE